MLTVVHKGAMASMYVLVLSPETKKKITGQAGPVKILIFTKSTSTKKNLMIIFPYKNDRTWYVLYHEIQEKIL